VLLKERAYRELKSLIQTGEMTSESALSERLLSERLGMSKTPIRAALELLEKQGLVTVSLPGA
jgi:DNA-binding GntR family transcriptional regulator